MHRRAFLSSLSSSVLVSGSALQLGAAPAKTAARSPKIKEISGIALTIKDFQRSRRFYTEVLGLAPDTSGKINPDLGMKFFMESGHVSVWMPGKWEEVNPHLVGRQPSDIGGKKHFNMFIDVSDAKAALENLKKHNVKLWGPRHFDNGEVHIDFEDPDGHLLEYVGRPSKGARGPKSSGPPKIQKIGEIALVVADLERSRKFYSDGLGLEEAHFGNTKPDGGVTFHFGDGYLGLWLPGKWKGANPHLPGNVGADLSGKSHLNVTIDLSEGQAAVDRLEQEHVKFWGPRYHRKNEPTGDVHIDFEDPDGHLLEFHGVNPGV